MRVLKTIFFLGFFKMKRILFCFISFFIFHFSFSQTPYKVFLVGDAGENEMTGEALDSLKSKMDANPNSAVVFLGDNTYKEIFFGLTEGFKGFDSTKVAIKKMKSQLEIINGYKGSAYFIPGNHDWWNLTTFERGKRKLKIEENFIEAILHDNKTIVNPDATFLPKNGSPGPAVADLDNGNVKLVFIDTNWLNLLAFKYNPKENLEFAKVFYQRLDSILTSANTRKQQVVVVGHHATFTTGNILNRTIKHPFLFKRIKQSYKDFPGYKEMSAQLNAIFEKHPGVYYAAGHLHALQYHTQNGVHYMISGSGSKTDPEKCTSTDCEIWNEQGFFEIDFYPDHQDVIMYRDGGKKSEKL
ncbi:MAG TPA: metallophosphoesterase [Bacteroidia bacterium]|jgi:hypothetical protein|nr:metallophosphoesterase [Bacteroidia bacterium]